MIRFLGQDGNPAALVPGVVIRLDFTTRRIELFDPNGAGMEIEEDSHARSWLELKTPLDSVAFTQLAELLGATCGLGVRSRGSGNNDVHQFVSLAFCSSCEF